MTKKYRIVERTFNTGYVAYVIQQQHCILRWIWSDLIIDRYVVKYDSLAGDEEYIKNRLAPEFVDKVIYSRKEKLEKLLKG